MLIENARILIVDDERANVLLLERILRKAGYAHLKGITDSREALGLVREMKPDLILLDLHMSHRNGDEVLVDLRAELPPDVYLPVLVLSADTLQGARNAVLGCGANDFLLKPFDREEVLLRVRNLLETRSLHLALRAHGERLEAEVERRTRELRQALHAAEEASRAKSQFLANVSHELRTPLNGLRGPLALISQRFGDALPEAARRMLGVTLRASERLEGGVLDILRLVDVQSGDLPLEIRPVRLEEFLEELASEYAPRAASRGVEYHSIVPTHLAPLPAEEESLKDVLRRILDNAIRFTDAGSVCVEVIADPATAEAREIQVRDTGEGIAAQHHAAIFQPFEQADNSDTRQHHGFGLGLAIAKALCDRLGWTLRVQSRLGKGSTFSVSVQRR